MDKWVKSIFSIELDNSIEYYIPARQETKITNFDIELMNKLKWYTFDQCKKKHSIFGVSHYQLIN